MSVTRLLFQLHVHHLISQEQINANKLHLSQRFFILRVVPKSQRQRHLKENTVASESASSSSSLCSCAEKTSTSDRWTSVFLRVVGYYYIYNIHDLMRASVHDNCSYAISRNCQWLIVVGFFFKMQSFFLSAERFPEFKGELFLWLDGQVCPVRGLVFLSKTASGQIHSWLEDTSQFHGLRGEDVVYTETI